MSGTFVPVDLDQVLDEFEEQEGCQSHLHHRHDFSHLEQESPKPSPNNDDHNGGVLLTSITEDVSEDLQSSGEHEALNEETVPCASLPAESTGQNNLLEADPFHNRIHSYSEDGSDCSNDSASISDVIAAAEAITGNHDEKLEDQEHHSDLLSDADRKDSSVIISVAEEPDTGIQSGEPESQELHAVATSDREALNSEITSAVATLARIWSEPTECKKECTDQVSLEEGENENLQIQMNMDSESESGHSVDNHSQSDLEKIEAHGSERASDCIPGTSAVSETNRDLSAGLGSTVELSSLDVASNSRSTICSLDGVSTEQSLSNMVDHSTSDTCIDPAKFETQPVDDSSGDVCLIQQEGELSSIDTKTRTDETQHVTDKDTDVLDQCTRSERGDAVPSNVDVTEGYCDHSPGVNCVSEMEVDGQLPSSHKDENAESLNVSANWELPSATNYMYTPDSNFKGESGMSANSTEETSSYPEQVVANIVHDQSNSDSSECFPGEGASGDVIDVEVEAVPESKDSRTKVKHVGFILPPTVVVQSAAPTARRISSGEPGLGTVPPLWVPDSVASHCMNCGIKFGVIKRKHHCRACGKVLCSACCNMKFTLAYMDGKEGRVCQVCCNALLRAQTVSEMTEELNNFPSLSEVEEPSEEEADEPGEPGDASSTNDQELLSECMEETDMGQVDQELSRSPSLSLPPPLQPSSSDARLQPDDTPSLPTPTSPAMSEDSDCLFRLDLDHVRSLMPPEKTVLPPVINAVGDSNQVKDKAVLVTENPDDAEVMYKLKGLGETVVFLVNKSLVVKVKIIKLNCCVKKKCWCFVTEGMGGANQEEMVILLECLPKESSIPGDIFSHFNTAYTYAKEGHTVSNLGYTIFGQPFLGSMDNAGFLYIKPTFQCLENIPVPSTPFVFGILIQRPETPWAQLFPLRLMLRLGAEFRYYPCPLWSVRNRAPVYGQIGQTILNLLADFKNFQYTLPPVTGLLVHMEEQQTKLLLPQDRYDEIVKVLNSTDDHVMALGATFSRQADSHLVCMQDDTSYKTQAINIQNLPRKVTGASFIVFTGALKASSPYSAKVNIVEDGILVQLTPEAILELRQALREMRDHSIKIGLPGRPTEEQVLLEWVTRVDHTHAGVCSEIDGLSLEGLPFITMHSGADFTRCSNLRVQCIDVFFMSSGAKPSQFKTDKKLNKMLGELSKAGCKALKHHLVLLSQQNMNRIGLRVNMDADSVGYNVGSNQQSLPADLMADLDNEMVPAVNNAATRYRAGPLVMELVFRILKLF